MVGIYNVYFFNMSFFIIMNDILLVWWFCECDNLFEWYFISIDMNMIKLEVRLFYCKFFIIRLILLIVLVYWYGYFINIVILLVE